ncbi:hypothetical protein [Legionella drancourtii]|uniref:Uncharacterized protein n=1 Tax=Legionella drancourtii LLAP12 TaxID=658187 RepID=G9EUG4_9GAMM|nr:hypothetical protein [Legionella drancourtii]EHL28964.1 hypothetical protein LDG_8958 [Legionella drancourtii LLAP12]
MIGALVSHAEIRKNARILAQGKRTNSFFQDVPNEVLVTIAGFTGNPEAHDEQASQDIAYNNFG